MADESGAAAMAAERKKHSTRVALAAGLIGIGRLAQDLGQILLEQDTVPGELDGLVEAIGHLEYGLLREYESERAGLGYVEPKKPLTGEEAF